MDVFEGYERGLDKLLEQIDRRLGKEDPRYADALALQARLIENIGLTTTLGDSENRRADRVEIVRDLNRLAQESLGVNYNDLCEIGPVRAKGVSRRRIVQVALAAILLVVATVAFTMGRTLFSRQPERAATAVVVSGNQNVVVSGTGNTGSIQIINPAPTTDPQVYNAQVQGQDGATLVAYNAAAQPLWQVDYGTRLLKAVVEDVDGDGRKEIIAASQEPGPRPGHLLAYDESGRLLDDFDTWQASIYAGGSKPKSNVVDFRIADLTGDGRNEIIAISNDVYWYASHVSTVQLAGGKFRLISTYWHPGLLKQMYVSDLNRDAVQEVVLVGENNDLQSVLPLDGNTPVALLLEGSAMSGQAPPWFGNGPRGSELWYGYVTPNTIPVGKVDFEDIDGDKKADVQVALADSCSYYVNILGTVVGKGRGSSCKGQSEFHMWRSRQQ